MTQITLPTMSDNYDDLPLPLIVAHRWNFQLSTLIHDGVQLYCLRDWLTGLVDRTFAMKKIRSLRHGGVFSKYTPIGGGVFARQETLPNGETIEIEYVADKMLYLLTQEIRTTEKRKSTTLVADIKEYLAASGAFVDLVRREPETVIESGALDPDAAIDAAIEAYRRMGKDDRWISARVDGKVKRVKFTAALKAAVVDLAKDRFALATDEIYLGLWKRTAAQLRGELSITKTVSLRDNQPTLALIYQGLAEEVCAQKLGDREELTWDEAREIIREVAKLIGVQAQATSRFLNVDLATGKTLLGAGQ